MSVLVLLVVGLVAGALARLLVPGRDPMGVLGTLVLGVAGAFLGGLFARLAFGGEGLTAGLLGAVAGSVVLLLAWRFLAGERRGVR